MAIKVTKVPTSPISPQVELAEKIGVSVGKVNYVLSAFVQKGIVKMENFKQSKEEI